jgi:putative CocE/NonD family hydrolase
LAITQWYAAAEQPPHLAAIAPWEGVEDFYRSSLFIGGIPETGFASMIIHFELFGEGRIEYIPDMMRRCPLMNGYWEEKIAQVEKIEIPAYVVASWTNPVHTKGTFDGYKRLASPKWLRVHNTQEWIDYYVPEYVEDLRRFFDRYLKGILNEWEKTPRVRLSILDPGGKDVVDRPESEFPLSRAQYRKLYLDAGGGLSIDPPPQGAQIRYKADDGIGRAVFTMKFHEDTELTGHMKLRLWVEAEGADDMDLFVYVSKLDADGTPLPNKILRGFISPGAQGMLRVSHREIEEKKSSLADPYLTHRVEQRLKPGEVVAVDIPIWPIGMLWHRGEQLQLIVQGHPAPSVYKDLIPEANIYEYDLRNMGTHIIHTGGRHDSYLLVPIIPR